MQGLDPAEDLALILDAATQAGEVALSYWRQDPKVWDKGDDQGPVTEADLAADAKLKALLSAARPGYGWLSEESAGRVEAGPSFIVDPIDGTRAFADGQATWAVSVAVALEGQPVAGAVVLPARGKTYAAARGQGATFNGAPLRASTRPEAQGAQVLANKWVLRDHFWRAEPPQIERHFRTSLAYRLALVGEGRFDAMLTLRGTWVWDIAAGALIASEAGAQVTDRRGAALHLGAPDHQVDGLIAGSPGVHQGLRDALA